MQRVIVLDDMQVRHDRFAEIFADCEVTHCLTFADFCAKVMETAFDVVCLDHDLNDAPGVDNTFTDLYGSKEFTGVDGARWLIQITALQKRTLPKVIVHSVNPTGAKRILNVLSAASFDAKWIPFSA